MNFSQLPQMAPMSGNASSKAPVTAQSGAGEGHRRTAIRSEPQNTPQGEPRAVEGRTGDDGSGRAMRQKPATPDEAPLPSLSGAWRTDDKTPAFATVFSALLAKPETAPKRQPVAEASPKSGSPEPDDTDILLIESDFTELEATEHPDGDSAAEQPSAPPRLERRPEAPLVTPQTPEPQRVRHDGMAMSGLAQMSQPASQAQTPAQRSESSAVPADLRTPANPAAANPRSAMTPPAHWPAAPQPQAATRQEAHNAPEQAAPLDIEAPIYAQKIVPQARPGTMPLQSLQVAAPASPAPTQQQGQAETEAALPARLNPRSDSAATFQGTAVRPSSPAESAPQTRPAPIRADTPQGSLSAPKAAAAPQTDRPQPPSAQPEARPAAATAASTASASVVPSVAPPATPVASPPASSNGQAAGQPRAQPQAQAPAHAPVQAPVTDAPRQAPPAGANPHASGPLAPPESPRAAPRRAARAPAPAASLSPRTPAQARPQAPAKALPPTEAPRSDATRFSAHDTAEVDPASPRAAELSVLHQDPRSATPRDLARHVATQIATAAPRPEPRMTEVRLDPEELGRVTLRLSADDMGVTLHVTAERADTMDLMRRHISLLQDSYRAMGYQRVEISINGQQTGGSHGQWSGGGGNASRNGAENAATSSTQTLPAGPETPTLAATPVRIGLRQTDKIDIRL
jgi:flagellar hook-length control protein FliK